MLTRPVHRLFNHSLASGLATWLLYNGLSVNECSPLILELAMISIAIASEGATREGNNVASCVVTYSFASS